MPELHILNLGAGVQSTTLYLMFMRGEIKPQIDYAIFADTMEEPQTVYDHLEWLKGLKGPPILVRSKGKLGDHLMRGVNSTGGRCASIPAFTAITSGTAVGQVRRQCSKEYKTEVIERCIRRDIVGVKPRCRVPKRTIVHQYFGISLDEGGRSMRIRDRMKPLTWAIPVFPLIDKFMTRANCLDWLVRFGVPHQTPRSACVFCPYHSDVEWDRIRREDTAGWARAVEIDRALRIPGNVVNRNLDQSLYLHRRCQPLELVQLDTRPKARDLQMPMSFYQECEGVCGV